MAELAARHGQDASGLELQQQSESGAQPGTSTHRRGSADSFRDLLSRLKKTNDSVQSELQTAVEAPIAPAPLPQPELRPAPAVLSAPIVIVPNPALLPPRPVEEAIVDQPAAYEPTAPIPIPTIDAKEAERRARMRAEAHAASKEIIARLRKAAGQPVDKEEHGAAPALQAEVLENEPEAEVQPQPVAEAAAIEQAQDVLPSAIQPVIEEASVAAEPPPTAAPEGRQRRRHPFFPDVFLDDDDAGEAAPVADAAQPEQVAAPVAEATIEQQAAALFVENDIEEPVATVEQPEPLAEQLQHIFAEPVEAAPGLEFAPEAELVPAVGEVAILAGAVPPLEQVDVAVVVEAEFTAPAALLTELDEAPAPVVEPPATPAADTGDDQHQEDLIEDEADAVRHLRGVEVKGIGDIAKAVFSAPTPAERAEFLKELASLSAQDPAAARPEVMAADEATLATRTASVRKPSLADDPFAKIAPDPAAHVNNEEPDEDSGELARSLLDMMLSSPSAGLPQERALAADALLKLIPKVPTKPLIAIAERMAIMDSPPNLLIARLINDPRIEIAGPLLEQCNHISDQVLGKVIASGQVNLQRLIARRRHLSAALTDQLIEFEDASVILTLVRNSGAVISHNSFNRLMFHAEQHHETLAPLATRSDLPPPVAFELFWLVPAELRRYLLSRFLTDSETLTKILKITKVMQGGGEGEGMGFANKQDAEAFMTALTEGRRADAEEKLAVIAGISAECAHRIVGDSQGEPLAIVFKAIGLTRAQFEDYLVKLQAPEVGIISPERQVLELQSTFNSMSFNKARILLTYWDWAVLKHGPYAAAQ